MLFIADKNGMRAFIAITIWLICFGAVLAGAINLRYDLPSQEEVEEARALIERDFANAVDPESMPAIQKEQVLAQYDHVDPKKLVPATLLKNALLYFDANEASFPNKKYITVVNLGIRSDYYRFFLIDMTTGAVTRYHTTHGQGSDPDDDGWATLFGNVPDSLKSSLGYVRVGEVYSGAFKVSLRLDGLSTTNSNMRARAVVFHGWDGVKEANVIQDRSNGCITLDWKVKDGVLEKIREGSLMYIGAVK